MKEFENIQEIIDRLTFTDDGMFQAVLSDPEISAELVERLLHIRVDHVEYPELEKTIAPFYTTKGVRLDVYLKDSDKIIDIELQCYPLKDPGKRSRYYQSMVDCDALMKGEDYSRLKESYILFICKHDPFRDENNKPYGLPCYTFRNACEEDSKVKLDDKTVKVFYNSSMYEKEKDERIRSFLHFVHTNDSGKDDFSSRLSEMVEKLKANEKFRGDYLAMNLHDRDIMERARQEGIEQGIQRNAVENARKFLSMNVLTHEQIAQGVGLSLEKVKELAEQLTIKNA